MVKRGLQQRGIDLIFGSPIAQQKVDVPSTEEKKQIILYLRDGLNPAEGDFTKYPNKIHKVMLNRLSEESEGILYMYLWWQSWGFGRNYCRTSYKIIEKETIIGSKKTAQRAMTGLVEKRFVVKALDKESERDVTQHGSLYRVLTPEEIQIGKTDEGILLTDIPIDGVVMMAIAKMTIAKNTDERSNSQGVVKMGIAKMANDQKDWYSQNDHTDIAKMGIAKMAILNENADNIRDSDKYSQNGYSQNDLHIKEDYFKDSLSQYIDLFYNTIGQPKISKVKRERAKKCFEELIQDGFTNDNIQFAIEWTLTNMKEKPYDFSIIKDTISQAMAAKKELEAKETKRIENERLKAQKEEDEKRTIEVQEKIKEHKENLNENQRLELREKALEEIRKTKGIKEEFITELFIEAKENEIIRRQFGIEPQK